MTTSTAWPKRRAILRTSATAAAACLMLVASGTVPAQGTLYRWVDAQGKVHYGDRPPAQDGQPATRVPIDPPARSAPKVPATRPAPAAEAVPAPPGQPVATPRPATPQAEANLPERGSEEDCRNWRIEYNNSRACFLRFTNRNGTVKAEAYKACEEVLDPGFECGPPVVGR